MLPGPAPSATYGVMPVTGPRGVRQPAPRSPPSTPISPVRISPKSTQLRLSANCHMATGVTQNVTISASGANILTINGVGGTGILIDNTNAFTLTISARVAVGAAQAWTNNSGNLFTVSGATVALGGNALTVNGTGTRLSQAYSAAVCGSNLTKDGSGTLTLTASNTYD